MESIEFDTVVMRVTEGKERVTVRLDGLEVGDRFELGSKQFDLTTKRTHLQECGNGSRVRCYGKWWVVYYHGRAPLLFPIPNNSPFGEWKGTRISADIPFPDEAAEILTFKELAVIAAS